MVDGEENPMFQASNSKQDPIFKDPMKQAKKQAIVERVMGG
jgi:hypothetical protein